MTPLSKDLTKYRHYKGIARSGGITSGEPMSISRIASFLRGIYIYEVNDLTPKIYVYLRINDIEIQLTPKIMPMKELKKLVSEENLEEFNCLPEPLPVELMPLSEIFLTIDFPPNYRFGVELVYDITQPTTPPEKLTWNEKYDVSRNYLKKIEP